MDSPILNKVLRIGWTRKLKIPVLIKPAENDEWCYVYIMSDHLFDKAIRGHNSDFCPKRLTNLLIYINMYKVPSDLEVYITRHYMPKNAIKYSAYYYIPIKRYYNYYLPHRIEYSIVQPITDSLCH